MMSYKPRGYIRTGRSPPGFYVGSKKIYKRPNSSMAKMNSDERNNLKIKITISFGHRSFVSYKHKISSPRSFTLYRTSLEGL